MSTVHIEIAPNGGRGKVEIDGHDIAPAVHGMNIQSEVGRQTRLKLDLRVHNITTLDAEHVQVLIDPTAAGFLERAGWTPPPGVASVLDRRADGCPCEWVEFWERPEGEMATGDDPDAVRRLLLGRTVPTCPIHGTQRNAIEQARIEAYGQGRDDEAAGLPLRHENSR